MPKPLDLTNPHRKIHVGIPYELSRTEVLDIAPIDLLNGMSKPIIAEFPSELISDEIKAQGLDMEFHWVNESGKTASLTSGLNIQPTDTFATCPPLDITLMGACQPGYTPTGAELSFIRKSYADSVAFLTICGGVIQAVAAGVLNGKTCTSPRPMLGMMKQMSSEITWVEKRYVQDGKVWTSGALLNGLDMMRAFVTKTWGNEGAGKIAQFLLKLGHFPVRDVDYKDAVGPL